MAEIDAKVREHYFNKEDETEETADSSDDVIAPVED